MGKKGKKKVVYLVPMDLEKAYESVNREVRWQRLEIHVVRGFFFVWYKEFQ